MYTYFGLPNNDNKEIVLKNESRSVKDPFQIKNVPHHDRTLLAVGIPQIRCHGHHNKTNLSNNISTNFKKHGKK